MTKVLIDRDGCISCGACWSTCPEIFEQNDEDARSQIIGKFQVDNNPAEGRVGDDLSACAQEGADSCPVQVIHVE